MLIRRYFLNEYTDRESSACPTSMTIAVGRAEDSRSIKAWAPMSLTRNKHQGKSAELSMGSLAVKKAATKTSRNEKETSFNQEAYSQIVRGEKGRAAGPC